MPILINNDYKFIPIMNGKIIENSNNSNNENNHIGSNSNVNDNNDNNNNNNNDYRNDNNNSNNDDNNDFKEDISKRNENDDIINKLIKKNYKNGQQYVSIAVNDDDNDDNNEILVVDLDNEKIINNNNDGGSNNNEHNTYTNNKISWKERLAAWISLIFAILSGSTIGPAFKYMHKHDIKIILSASWRCQTMCIFLIPLAIIERISNKKNKVEWFSKKPDLNYTILTHVIIAGIGWCSNLLFWVEGLRYTTKKNQSVGYSSINANNIFKFKRY
jgi:hypothetical protein